MSDDRDTQIRRLHSEGMSQRRIAAEVGTAQSTISEVLNRERPRTLSSRESTVAMLAAHVQRRRQVIAELEQRHAQAMNELRDAEREHALTAGWPHTEQFTRRWREALPDDKPVMLP